MDETKPNGDATSLGGLVRKGMRAVVTVQLASQVVSFVVLAMLFRQLGPDPFGLLGMVMPLLLLARMLGGLSLHVATVQRDQLSDAEASWLFWMQLGSATLAAIGFALVGNLLAWAYQVPAVRSLCYALAATLIANALGTHHVALLERQMAVGQVARYRLLALIAGGAAAILLAWRGWNVWAWVTQQYVELMVLAALAWWGHPFRPRWPKRLSAGGALFRFGSGYSLSGLLFFLAWNLDKVLLALALVAVPRGQALLGMYTQVFNLMMRPVYLVTTPLTSVMLPALSRASRQNGEFADLVASFYRLVGIVLLPCGIGLSLVADDAMRVLGGPEWGPAGRMLAALAPAISALGLVNIAGSVLAAAGQTRRLCWGALVVMVMMSQGYIAGIVLGRRFGGSPGDSAVGVAISFSVVLLIVLCVPYTRFVLSSSGASGARVWGSLRRPLLSALLMGLAVWVLRGALPESWGPLQRLGTSMLVGVAVYTLSAYRDCLWTLEYLGFIGAATRTDQET